MRSPTIALSILAAALSAGAMAHKADKAADAAPQVLSRDPVSLRAPVEDMRKRQAATTEPTPADPAAVDAPTAGDDVPAVEADPTTETAEDTTQTLDEIVAPADTEAEDPAAGAPAVLDAVTGAAPPPTVAAPAAPSMKARGDREARGGRGGRGGRGRGRGRGTA